MLWNFVWSELNTRSKAHSKTIAKSYDDTGTGVCVHCKWLPVIPLTSASLSAGANLTTKSFPGPRGHQTPCVVMPLLSEMPIIRSSCYWTQGLVIATLGGAMACTCAMACNNVRWPCYWSYHYMCHRRACSWCFDWFLYSACACSQPRTPLKRLLSRLPMKPPNWRALLKWTTEPVYAQGPQVLQLLQIPFRSSGRVQPSEDGFKAGSLQQLRTDQAA